MTLIEGIGDEVTHILVALFVIVIGVFAWWTTNTSDQRHISTVVLLERRRHRARGFSNLTRRVLMAHTQNISISEADTTPVSGSSSEDNVEENQTEDIQQSTASSSHEETPPQGPPPDTEETERTTIIRAMDDEASVVRQRRLAFYSNWNNNANAAEESAREDKPAEEAAAPAETLPAEHIRMEHNYAESEERQPDGANNIRIRLKFINDDLKQIEGSLDEKLGDFKRRHFESEINANKLVRLIFNGHVLQQDGRTLRQCGLFDDCVVHCLVHQRRGPSPGEAPAPAGRAEFPDAGAEGVFARGGLDNGNFNNNAVREWDLENMLWALITLVLLGAWYFKYYYSQLYTVTATVGMIFVTGILTVIMIVTHFTTNNADPQQPRAPVR